MGRAPERGAQSGKLVKYLTNYRLFAIFAPANTSLHDQTRGRIPQPSAGDCTRTNGIPPLNPAYAQRARIRNHIRKAEVNQLPVARPGNRPADARRTNRQGQGQPEHPAEHPRTQRLHQPEGRCSGPPQQAGLSDPEGEALWQRLLPIFDEVYTRAEEAMGLARIRNLTAELEEMHNILENA